MSRLTITISIQTIAGSRLGINCPNQHSQRGRGKEGRQRRTHTFEEPDTYRQGEGQL